MANAVVIVACFAVLGWNFEGAGSAARNTARFASLFFAAGFAGPRLNSYWPRLPAPATLIQAFCTAQMVHFASVALLHLRFSEQPALHLGGPQVAIVLLGFSLVATAGLTATPREGKLYRLAQLVSIHLIFLVYFLDYLRHPVKPLRVLAVVFILALASRYLPHRSRSGTAPFPASSV